MKTYNRLKNQIVAFDNLLGALKKARKGKKYTQSAAAFWVEQEAQRQRYERSLRGNCKVLGQTLRNFWENEPRQRLNFE